MWIPGSCPVGAIPNEAAPPTRDKSVDDSIGVPQRGTADQPGVKPRVLGVGMDGVLKERRIGSPESVGTVAAVSFSAWAPLGWPGPLGPSEL